MSEAPSGSKASAPLGGQLAGGIRVLGVGLIGRIERLCATVEARTGLPVAALILGLILVATAAIISRPSLKPVNHGALYSRLSEDPLSFSEKNWVQLRILGPLVGHLLFLRGRLFPILPSLFLVLFLASIYWHGRRRGFGGAMSLGLAALMAFSTVTLFPLYGAGYVDPIGSFLIFWCLASSGRPLLQSVFFGLALFTHESALFALPWLLLPPEPGQPRRWRNWLVLVVACSVAVGLLFVWREYGNAQLPVRFSNEYYLKRMSKNWPIIRELWPLGVFMAFRLFWAFPVLAAADGLRGRRWHRVAWLGAVVAGALAQLLVAHDVSRLMGLAFPAVLKGAEFVRSERGEAASNRLLWSLILLNFLVPAYEVRPPSLFRFWPVWWTPFIPEVGDTFWPPR